MTRRAVIYSAVYNKQTGAAVVTTGNPTSPAILFALGARSASQVGVHSGTSYTDVLDYAYGNWGLSGDQSPTSYRADAGKPYQSLTSGIKTAPFNTGSPLAPHLTQPQATAVSGTLTSAITDVTSFLQFIAWLFHPKNWLRLAEFLAGLMLFLIGVRIAIRPRGSSLARRFVAATPVGRAMRVRSGRRAGRRAGQRDRAYSEARRRERTGASN